MLRRQRVTVVLTPSALEVVVTDSAGHAVDRKRMSLDPVAVEDAWKGNLSSLDSGLVSLLRSLDVPRKTQADVVYLGPDEAVEARDFDASAPKVRELAEAKMLHELPFNREQAVCATRRLRCDALCQQTLVLGVADRDVHVNSLFSWLRRAGLAPVGAVPLEALVIGETLEDMQTVREQTGRTGRVVQWRLGEFVSVLVVSTQIEGGLRLELVRAFRVGFDALVEALARAIQQDDTAGVNPQDTERARTTLLDIGIPKQDQIVDPLSGKTGRDALPLMQPVMQRMALEAKQTLRYGLEDNDVRSILVSGPGACIAGLGEMLEQFIEVDIEPVFGTDQPDDQKCAGCELRLGQRQALGFVPLVPRAVAAQRESGQLSRAMRVGAVAALAFLGWTAADAWTTKDKIDQQVAAFEPQIERIRRVTSEEAQVRAMGDSVGKVEFSLYEAMGTLPDWKGLLTELSSLCNDNVRMIAVTSSTNDHINVLEMRGVSLESAADEKQEHLAAFLHSLSESPLFTDVLLESTRRTEFQGEAGRQFVIKAHCVALPPRNSIFASHTEDDS